MYEPNQACCCEPDLVGSIQAGTIGLAHTGDEVWQRAAGNLTTSGLHRQAENSSRSAHGDVSREPDLVGFPEAVRRPSASSVRGHLLL